MTASLSGWIVHERYSYAVLKCFAHSEVRDLGVETE
jgi:hypothetical protein